MYYIPRYNSYQMSLTQKHRHSTYFIFNLNFTLIATQIQFTIKLNEMEYEYFFFIQICISMLFGSTNNAEQMNDICNQNFSCSVTTILMTAFNKKNSLNTKQLLHLCIQMVCVCVCVYVSGDC